MRSKNIFSTRALEGPRARQHLRSESRHTHLETGEHGVEIFEDLVEHYEREEREAPRSR